MEESEYKKMLLKLRKLEIELGILKSAELKNKNLKCNLYYLIRGKRFQIKLQKAIMRRWKNENKK